MNDEDPDAVLKSTPVRSGIVIPRSSKYQVWTVAQIGLAGGKVTTYVANAPANTDISFGVAGVQKSVVKSDATGSVRTTLPLPAGQFGSIDITATASGKVASTSIQVVKTVVTTSKKQGKTTVTFSVSNASPCVDCQIDVSFGDKPMEYADIRANGKAVVTMTATRPGKVSYTVNLRENRLGLGFPDSIQELASGKVTIT